MLVVRIELWPRGDAARARSLGVASIVNVGDGTHAIGNYDVTLFKAPEYSKQAETRPLQQMLIHPLAREIWKKGRIEGFPRQRLGPWDLLFRALGALTFKRNPGMPVDAEISDDVTRLTKERDELITLLLKAHDEDVSVLRPFVDQHRKNQEAAQ